MAGPLVSPHGSMAESALDQARGALMGLYERYFLPKLLNLAMRGPDLMRLRASWVPKASGRVLEIGIGSGLNLPYYSEDVTSVTGVDPSAELRAYAEEAARDATVPVEFLTHGAESIPEETASFDTAMVTWTLCTVPDAEVVLAEIRRLLKPGGRLIFVEHGESPDANVARWQARLNPCWRVIGGGCHLNRRADTGITEAGFAMEALEAGYIQGPRFATYNYRGIARRV